MNASFVVSVELGSFLVRSSPPLGDSPTVVAVAGHVPGASTSDERRRILAEAYARHGPSLAAAVPGQWAAVVTDRPARRIVLATDSLGVRPVHFVADHQRVVASPDLSALVAEVGVPALSDPWFHRFLATGHKPLGSTPFEGIERLDGGRALVVEQGRRRWLRPWLPPESGEQVPGGDPVTLLRRLIDGAVSSCLPVTGPVLCELSGGLDSTTVLASARASRPDVEAITITSTSGRAGDDLEHAREASRALRVPWHLVDLDRYPPLSDLDPEPFAIEPGDELRRALHLEYRRVVAASGASVVLTGLGGDDVLGGGARTPLHVASSVWRRDLRGAARGARRWAEAGGDQRPWLYWLAHHGARPAVRHAFRLQPVPSPSAGRPSWMARGRAHRSRRGHGPPPELRLRLPEDQQRWTQILQRARDVCWPPFRQALGIDSLHPLFDRALVEHMLGLGGDAHHGPEVDRVLHRRALAGRVPERIRLRTTKSSDQRLIEGALQSDTTVRQLTDQSRLVDRGWVRAGPWREALRRAAFGVADSWPQLTAALSTELWLRGLEQWTPPAPWLVGVAPGAPRPPGQLLQGR